MWDEVGELAASDGLGHAGNMRLQVFKSSSLTATLEFKRAICRCGCGAQLTDGSGWHGVSGEQLQVSTIPAAPSFFAHLRAPKLRKGRRV